jgi:hypothetical protein
MAAKEPDGVDGALLTTFPGDTTMAKLEQVKAFAKKEENAESRVDGAAFSPRVWRTLSVPLCLCVSVVNFVPPIVECAKSRPRGGRGHRERSHITGAFSWQRRT